MTAASACELVHSPVEFDVFADVDGFIEAAELLEDRSPVELDGTRPHSGEFAEPHPQPHKKAHPATPERPFIFHCDATAETAFVFHCASDRFKHAGPDDGVRVEKDEHLACRIFCSGVSDAPDVVLAFLDDPRSEALRYLTSRIGTLVVHDYQLDPFDPRTLHRRERLRQIA